MMIIKIRARLAIIMMNNSNDKSNNKQINKMKKIEKMEKTKRRLTFRNWKEVADYNTWVFRNWYIQHG